MYHCVDLSLQFFALVPTPDVYMEVTVTIFHHHAITNPILCVTWPPGSINSGTLKALSNWFYSKYAVK